jgi:hypothetical protein
MGALVESNRTELKSIVQCGAFGSYHVQELFLFLNYWQSMRFIRRRWLEVIHLVENVTKTWSSRFISLDPTQIIN